MMKPQTFWRVVLAAVFAACCVLLLTGCTTGTISDSQQTCESTGGLFGGEKVSCTGSVGAVRGEPSLGVIDADEELSGDYRLDATISVGKGEAKAFVDTADGAREGGKVSPGEPLRISAVMGISSNDEEVSVDLKVLGKEVNDLRYEATVVPQD